jgi:hypothetical protein
MRILLLLFSTLLLFSCKKEKKEIDFDQDIYNYILFNEGSYWTYTHKVGDVETLEKIELIKNEINLVESADGENLVKELHQKYYNHFTKEFFTLEAKEYMLPTQPTGEDNPRSFRCKSSGPGLFYNNIFYSNVSVETKYFTQEYYVQQETNSYPGVLIPARVAGNLVSQQWDPGLNKFVYLYNGTILAYSPGIGLVAWQHQTIDESYIVNSYYIAP